MDKETFIDCGDNNWQEFSKGDKYLRDYLYSRFTPDKILVIRDEAGEEIDRLRLDELYN